MAAAAGRSSRGASAAASPPLSHSHIKSGSRQSDRLPQEMTPVTEGSAANLQASFCLNSLSPCRQILIFSVTASLAGPPAPRPPHWPPSPSFSSSPQYSSGISTQSAHVAWHIPAYVFIPAALYFCCRPLVSEFEIQKSSAGFFSAVFFGGGLEGVGGPERLKFWQLDAFFFPDKFICLCGPSV